MIAVYYRGIVIDPDKCEVRVLGRKVRLNLNELNIAMTLFMRPGRAVTINDLLDILKITQYEPELIDVYACIKGIRQKLFPKNHTLQQLCIERISGTRYVVPSEERLLKKLGRELG